MSSNVAIDEPQTELAPYEERANTLQPTDERTEEQCLLLITEAKAAAKRLEAKREEEVRPHLEKQKEINGKYKPVIEAFDRLWRLVDLRVSDYRKKKQLAIEEANRKAIAEAEAIRKEQERKAEEARREAERLKAEAERLEQERIEREFQDEMKRLELEKQRKAQEAAAEEAKIAGDAKAARDAEAKAEAARQAEQEQQRKAEADRKAAAEEQAKLERAALKQDVKADTAEMKASMVSPVIQGSMAKTVELSTGTKATGKKVDVWMFTNGMPIDGEYYQDDPRVKEIPARYFVLDTKKLGKDVMNGVPIDGTKKDFKYVTTSRTK